MLDSNNAMEVLEELRAELAGEHGFFSKKPDLQYCLELCEKVIKILPDAMKEAEYVKKQRKEILANADVVAKNTMRAAEEKAANMVSESEVVRAAEKSAKQIIENAYAQCDNLILRTKEHLDNLFKETEQFLLSTLTVVRTNREELRNANVGGNNQ